MLLNKKIIATNLIAPKLWKNFSSDATIRLLPEIAKHISPIIAPDDKQKIVLNLGSGKQKISTYLAKHIKNIEIFDMDLAKHVSINNADFILGNMMDLPFKTKSAGMLMVFFALEYVKDQQKALEEMSRVLEPGGKAFFLFHATNSRLLAHHLRIEENQEELDSLKYQYDNSGDDPIQEYVLQEEIKRLTFSLAVGNYFRQHNRTFETVLDIEQFLNNFFVIDKAYKTLETNFFPVDRDDLRHDSWFVVAHVNK